MKNIFSVVMMVSVSFFGNAGFAAADAWWGKGYRSPDWVLENGGSLIKYRIIGKEDSDDYKARLYLGDKMVELEYGGSGYFDDAISNTYTVIFFKGSKVKGKAVVSVKPGETVSLKFDIKKGRAEKSSDLARNVRTAPKPAESPVSESPTQTQQEVPVEVEEAVLGDATGSGQICMSGAKPLRNLVDFSWNWE